jgi:hypothetical protein
MVNKIVFLTTLEDYSLFILDYLRNIGYLQIGTDEYGKSK